MSKKVALRVQPARVTLSGGQAGVRVHRALPERHDFYAVIGRVATEAAHLEHFLDLIIWEFFGAEQVKAACLTSQMIGPGPRCRAIVALCQARGVSKKVIKRVNEISGKTLGVMEMRNRLVHDAWYVEDGSGQIAQFRVLLRNEPLEFGMIEVDMNEVEKTLRSLSKQRQEISTLRSDIMTELASLKKTNGS